MPHPQTVRVQTENEINTALWDNTPALFQASPQPIINLRIQIMKGKMR